MLQNSFYEAVITLKPKPYEDTARKENYRLISLMKVDVHFLNNILTTKIQQYIECIVHQ